MTSFSETVSSKSEVIVFLDFNLFVECQSWSWTVRIDANPYDYFHLFGICAPSDRARTSANPRNDHSGYYYHRNTSLTNLSNPQKYQTSPGSVLQFSLAFGKYPGEKNPGFFEVR